MDGCQSGFSSVLYRLVLVRGVCRLWRCRSAIQLLKLLVVLSRQGVVQVSMEYKTVVKNRVKVKVVPLYVSVYTDGRWTYISKPITNSKLEGGVWSVARPNRFVPGKHQVSNIQEVGWASAPGRTGARIDPRTAQPLGSRCIRLTRQDKRTHTNKC